MKFGTMPVGAICGLLLFGVLMMLAFINNSPPPELIEGQETGNAVFASQMQEIPRWVRIWMEWQHYIMASSLIFVLWHREAQIYALGPVMSHVVFGAQLALLPADLITTGIASVSHWVWLIPLVVLIRAWPSVDKRSGYGVWMTIAILQMSFSLLFDIPQGIAFLAGLLT